MPKWDIHWKVMGKILQAAVSTMGDLYRNCVRKLEACLCMLFIPTHLLFLSLSLFPLSLPLFVSRLSSKNKLQLSVGLGMVEYICSRVLF